MDESKIIKLIRIAIEVTESKGEKTITPNNIHTATRIMFMDETELLSGLLTSGNNYITAFNADNKVAINSFKNYNNLVRDHLKNCDYNFKYKLGSLTIPYLCGIIDKANGYPQY